LFVFNVSGFEGAPHWKRKHAPSASKTH
jgi:hypothetical protein